ncbi:MAG: hypothetical protein ABI611_08550 [Solirubrobacteraceae bacterium]
MTGVVAQAGVLDLERARERQLSNGVVRRLLGGAPEQVAYTSHGPGGSPDPPGGVDVLAALARAVDLDLLLRDRLGLARAGTARLPLGGPNADQPDWALVKTGLDEHYGLGWSS